MPYLQVLMRFYRTSAGAEIDLVIEFGLDEYWAVEIKASRTPTLKKVSIWPVRI